MLLRHRYNIDEAKVRSTGRVLDVVLVPVNRPQYVVDDAGPYREAFTQRSFAHVDPTRVKLQYTHFAELPLGVGMPDGLTADGQYWRASMRVAHGERGDAMLDLVNDDVVQTVSIGFAPGLDHEHVDADGPYIVRTKVKKLDHVALVDPSDVAQYPDARVLAVRAHHDEQRAALLQWVEQQRRAADSD